jgi:hypothetical protein
MARRIIRQPDGLLSVWSTHVDNFIIIDATPEEVLEELLKEIIQKETVNLKAVIDRPYTNYDYYLRRIEEVHGQQEEEEEV